MPGTLPLILLVISLCAVVGIEADRIRLFVAPTPLGFWWAWIVRLGGAGLTALGLAVLLGHRREVKAQGVRRADPTPRSLRTAAILMGLLAVLALFVAPPIRSPLEGRWGPGPSSGEDRDRGGPGESGSPSSGSMSGSAGAGGGGGGVGGSGGVVGGGAGEEAGPSLLQRVTRNLPLLLLLTIAALCVLLIRRRMRLRWEPPFDDALLAPEEAEAGLEASLEEALREQGPPREVVTAAYRRLLQALAEAGASRRPQEAPHEHLFRVLGPLGVPSAPLHELADLYVVAQFSRRPVVEEHRRRAIRSLETSLMHLRIARERSEAEPGKPVMAGEAG